MQYIVPEVLGKLNDFALRFLSNRAIYAYNYTSSTTSSAVALSSCYIAFIELNISKFEVCIMPTFEGFQRFLWHIFLVHV
jgi:hypothetical protein